MAYYSCKPLSGLNHNFPMLAEESGFSFNTHKPRIPIEWNKIRLIDTDSIIRERKFTLVEQHTSDILNCVLESEFDVRILDEGVLKIFRLSQLAVEYQQFCRKYLDHSVYLLREELSNVLKELETAKRSLNEKEQEIKKLKRKPKQSLRAPLPYGNENIASLILKSLNNNKGDIFSSTSQTDVLQYNKCSYCEKVFLNQLYLKSHISRRHPNFQEVPHKDEIEKVIVHDTASTRLNEEVEELKLKLKQMEDILKNADIHNSHTIKQGYSGDEIKSPQNNSKTKIGKETRDAEVLTDDDGLLNDKNEQWKKEEYEKYNKEIILLRQQIIDIVNSKEKQKQTYDKDEFKIMEELQATIKQQSSEILALKKELLNGEETEREKRKDIETQMLYWVKKTEEQSKEYRELLDRLNDMAKEAREYRTLAEAEKEKSSKLEEIVQYHIGTKTETKSSKNNDVSEDSKDYIPSKINLQIAPTEDLITLSKLQQKAQELLNMNETSSTESSVKSEENIKAAKKSKNKISMGRSTKFDNNQPNLNKSYDEFDTIESKKNQTYKRKSNPAKQTSRKENGYVNIPSSPLKIVRAKLSEEVNNRLKQLGVDPLKSGLSKPFFQKQRMRLQKEQEMKIKKFPKREKLLHSIIANLEKNISTKPELKETEFISSNKSTKIFNLSSVLTNVKTKALSIVKPSESSKKINKTYNDMAKKAMALLKTPPGSAQSSPISQKQKDISPNKTVKKVKKYKTKMKRQSSELLSSNKKSNSSEAKETSEESSEDQRQISKTVHNIVKSPIRHPTNATENQKDSVNHLFLIKNGKYNNDNVINAEESKKEVININKKAFFDDYNSSNDIESVESSPRKFLSEENINNIKQTKGVLKNASSMSSLNKKKVLFDMDAIQMKSMSASPSQSITEKSDNNEKYEHVIKKISSEEWDISSIENEPPKAAINVHVASPSTSKVAELKQSIESQLSRRNPSLSTALVGGVDVLTAPIKKTSFGGSNTSLGSSILDETDSAPMENTKKYITPKTVRDDSDIEISDLINEDNQNYIKSY